MTNFTLQQDEKEKLFQLALIARETSYSPYSKFRVGAALLSEDGTFFKGCNVENASFGAAICAERTAYVKAVSEGHQKFKALAVSTDQVEFVSPCGICRQFIAEFSSPNMPVFFLNNKGEHKEYTFGQLLPFAFTSDDM
ncbi:cytidine deaminase [Cokeromyces recurvatus]|uniref:cytidine deaminase n=1 Tax=Cokeromyces recurvatus TaxID=90255 RepID=UPI00222094DE|nr:cytidine deaminase [Cokeromyces recurvatus]KAI7904374.1 cytidine deaminase [Cokeromyces recurvatus]